MSRHPSVLDDDAPVLGLPRALRREHWLGSDLAVALAGLALLLAWDASGLDLTVIRWYGTAQGFAWRDQWLTRDLLHAGGRWLAFAALGLILVNLWKPVFTRLGRGERWLWLGLTLVCLLAVPGFKQLSLTSCPWSLAEFGGVAQYVSHWRPGVSDGGSGHCFPSGHATSAFAFVSGYVVLRGHHPVAARRWLIAVIAAGALFAWAQTARGAHYPSHSMWTAWACWVICTGGAALWARHAAAARRTG